MSLSAPPDQDIVIVGATGDLARRKLLPALYNLSLAGFLPERGRIIGYSRSQQSDEDFRAAAGASIRRFSRTGLDEKAWANFAERLHWVSSKEGGWPEVKRLLTGPRRLIYLSVAPSLVPDLVQELGQADLVAGTSLVIEKPFGHDLSSARVLDGLLHQVFEEPQIFRIDHYLGKETVQNLLVFRFGNALFERVWNRDAIDYVQMTVAESIGIEGRGDFYDPVGALRDIIQNHVLQTLALLTMEPPATLKDEAIRDEKNKLFIALRPVDPAQVVRGQYSNGWIEGQAVPAYRDEPGVAPRSTTETYVAMRLAIENWRWAGVPIYVRTGKRLPIRATEVQVVFRDAPIRLFAGAEIAGFRSNYLTLQIQPDEGITFAFLAKSPGPALSLEPVRMRFGYEDAFMVEPAEAYERLIQDALDGDRTLFVRGDAVERAWAVVEPALAKPTPICFYRAGTWGPPEADALIAPHRWHLR
ncbi:MAG TPA: glucose-6-phosphate dehydrogenase [Dehalococcoidia bacterium]|nr:glucose-6-phosphate dehydrogenase [Dehalococcoidia bacterium]